MTGIRRVLFVHNAYQHRGGEDSVVSDEMALLRARGHAVESYARSNDEIPGLSRLALAQQTLWSRRTLRELETVVESFRPDVIHVHNTFPLISPSLYWAAEKAGVPVVQTLHNFRLLCPQAMLLREGRVCEDCVGHLPWRGVVRACYRGSMAQSGVLGAMLVLHRSLGTWQNKVTRYIALNAFCRGKFIEGGLPPSRIAIKPNFVDLPAPPDTTRSGVLFVGRLSPEKGISTLAGAAKRIPGVGITIIGTGPEDVLLQGLANVQTQGFCEADTVHAAMGKAACLVLPSICYENFPRTLVEAFACGLPVVASRLGALADLIREGETGLLFEPSNAADLADKLSWVASHPAEMQRMGQAARAEYEANYTADINYRQLMTIYDEAIQAFSPH
ncbi:MAG: glycosyltransferase family 4 protein [Thiobacillus sp.]|uniref:glycosyltransferase family 4 protein n=1 Tax=Thiobacillus sp. TaxID=924 RepID=UPI0027364E45|nr:glycosyltransferase family 4 protein [Thiobacillus sp.]MDP3584435.1 glycosyltransferase family 4 protein [Thiobacillus sp.]